MDFKLSPLILLFFFSLLFLPARASAELIDPALDRDLDGLSDEAETRYATDLSNPDTDGDGYFDGAEIAAGYSPHTKESKKLSEHDYDGDGLTDQQEAGFGTSVGEKDSDRDGYSDYDEKMNGYDPLDPLPRKKFVHKVLVNLSTQRLQFLVGNDVMMDVPVSTGLPGKDTPAGTFTVFRKLPVARYIGPTYNIPNVKWNLEFKSKYFLHTAYWHNDFGIRPRSSGCVNMREADAAVVYRYAPIGTVVEVVGATPKKALSSAL